MFKMKTNFIKWMFLSFLSGMILMSCEKEIETIVPKIEVSSSSITISRLGLNDEGNTSTIDVESNVYWRATVQQEGEWLEIFPKAGTGSVTIELTAKLNDDAERRATILLETLDGTKSQIQIIQSSKDETIYYHFEDFGTESISNIDVNFFDQWTKKGIGSLFTKYTGLHSAAVDNNNSAAGYEGASGGNNILFPSAESALIWGQVDTKGVEYFTLSFGAYSLNTFNSSDLRLYISKNNEEWIPLNYTRGTNSGWGLVKSNFKVADLSSMHFKVVSKKEGLRIDDIVLLEDPSKQGEEIVFQTIVDDGMPVGHVYFEEDFSWITEETFGGTAANFPTNELGFTNANITPAQKDTINKYGWTQELGSTYLRVGLMKLSKTKVSGDLISPPFSTIAPFKAINVQVSFDVAMYASASGTLDLDGITIEVRNGGTINSQALTSYTTNVDFWLRTGEEQTEPMKTMTVTIYGATSRTQFRIRSAVENSEQNRLNKSNRFFFDNFKVTKAPNE